MNGISIALVNALPGYAGQAAERRFTALLAEAAGTLQVRVHLLRLDGGAGVPGDDRALGSAMLPALRPDALVVTGAEPQTGDLRDEKFWPALAGVFEWAQGNAVSVLASCLSAHAMVLHADGIARRRLPEKCFGVFRHRAGVAHPLVAGLPSRMVVPHSRWNDVSEAALRDCGYGVLIGSGVAGAHVFAKQLGCLMVGVQGHPEYAAATLWGEYRRDMLRFLGGEQPSLPRLPRGCVPKQVQEQLLAFTRRAALDRRPELMEECPALPAGEAPWRRSAVKLFGNWLQLVAERRPRRQMPVHTASPILVRAEAARRPGSDQADAPPC